MDSSPTILVADRNPHVRQLLRRELAAAGYRVEVAGDGRQVLARLAKGNSLDLLVLDLDLPYVDGLELLGRLRGQPLPVLVHTDFGEFAEHPAVRHAAGFLEKCDVELLLETIEELLRERAEAGEDRPGGASP